MLTFWDTVMGQQLARTLVRELPKLTEGKRQYTVLLEDADPRESGRLIDKEIEKGSTLDHVIDFKDGSKIFVFSR